MQDGEIEGSRGTDVGGAFRFVPVSGDAFAHKSGKIPQLSSSRTKCTKAFPRKPQDFLKLFLTVFGQKGFCRGNRMLHADARQRIKKV